MAFCAPSEPPPHFLISRAPPDGHAARSLWPTADCVYSCSICISLAGSRRQLSIRKNERKGESDEPDTPLLGEVDVVIGGEKSNQANNAAKDGFQQGLAVKPQPPPGWRRSQIPQVG